jgi:predicted nucleic acid-binding protein
MSIFVVDASVAVKWFHQEAHSAHALKLLATNHEMHAPDFLYLELDNVICRLVRQGLLNLADAVETRNNLWAVDVERHPAGDLRDLAFGIANDTRRSLYDCLYVALAVTLTAPMATADRKLYDALSGGPFGKYVLWVEDIA